MSRCWGPPHDQGENTDPLSTLISTDMSWIPTGSSDWLKCPVTFIQIQTWKMLFYLKELSWAIFCSFATFSLACPNLSCRFGQLSIWHSGDWQHLFLENEQKQAFSPPFQFQGLQNERHLSSWNSCDTVSTDLFTSETSFLYVAFSINRRLTVCSNFNVWCFWFCFYAVCDLDFCFRLFWGAFVVNALPGFSAFYIVVWFLSDRVACVFSGFCFCFLTVGLMCRRWHNP